MFKQKTKTPKSIQGALLLAVSLVLLVAGFGAFLTAPRTAVAATNGTINFQARLLTAAGNVVPDGTYNVEFKLYNVATSGTALWTETRTSSNKVTVKNGYLTVNLGSVTAFGDSINWDQELWLTMNIGGTGSPSWDGEMNPRLKLTSVPYAFRSGAVVSADGTGILTAANGETGTICVQNSANCGFVQGQASDFIQNQAGADQTSNFRIDGTGKATAFQASDFDTSSAEALGIGTTNATAINLNQDTTVAAGNSLVVTSGTVTFTGGTTGDALVVSNSTSTGNIALFKDNTTTVLTLADGGAATFQNSTDSTGAFRVLNANGDALLAVNTTGTDTGIYISGTGTGGGGSRLFFGPTGDTGTWIGEDGTTNTNVLSLNGNSGINLLVNNSTVATLSAGAFTISTNNDLILQSGDIELTNGTLTLGGNTVTSYVTPLGSSVPTKINIPNYDLPNFGQVLALGVTSGSSSSARGITVLDARTSSHQPSIAVVSPDQNNLVGFSWDGSNTTPAVKSTTSDLTLQAGGVNAVTVGVSGGDVVLNLGIINSNNGALQFSNAANNSIAAIQATNVTSSYTMELPTVGGSAGDCLYVHSVAGSTEQLKHGGCFLQGGSSFGTAANMGTADNFALNFITNGTTRATIAADGSSLTLASNTDLILQGTTAYISNPQGQTNGEAFGQGATVSGSNATAVGNGATALVNSVAIGRSATTLNFGAAVAIGNLTNADSFAVAIGSEVDAASEAVAIGDNAQADVAYGIAIGSGTHTTGQSGIAIGRGATADLEGIALGASAVAGVQQLVIGGDSDVGGISEVYVGNGVTNDTPTSFKLQGTSAAAGQNNLAGANVTIAGGQSTGNAQGGSINLQVSAVGTSGSSQNSLSTVATFGSTSLTLGSATLNTAINLTSGTGAINIGTGNQARSISIGTGAAAQIIAIGSTNSTSSTTIQGGSGNIVLSTSTGNRVQVGSATTDATAVLFTVDSYNNGTDPTGTNGSLYYNTSTNTFRCYQNGAWVDCVTASGGFVNLQNAYTNSTGGNTSEIILDNTRGALDIQDRSTSNSGSIGANLFNIRATAANNSTAGALLFGVGNTGAVTIQNSANSTSAFRIQNAGGGDLFKADSTNSIITLLGNNPAAIPSWTANSNNFAAGRWAHASVVVDGYVYVIGGKDDNDDPQSTVYYAKLNANGSIGTWASTTSLPDARGYLSAVTANGYVYAIGGGNTSNGGMQSTVYYAKVNPDGTLGTWNSTTSLPAARFRHTSIAANGYVYVMGGQDSTPTATNTVYYARLNPDGTVGSWNTSTITGVTNDERFSHSTVVANGYVYLIAGTDGNNANLSDTIYAKLNADGTLGSWATTSSFSSARTRGAAAALNGYVYYYGGQATNTNEVYYAQLNANGTLGTWTQTTNLTNGRRNETAVTANGYMYIIGGEDGIAYTTQLYASPGRVSLGGSLDLVGNNGETLAEGGSGGNLTAGDTRVVGSLNVTDASYLKGGATIGNSLAVNGMTSVSVNNSNVLTSAFRIIQNGSGDAGLEFNTTSTGSSFFVGQDASDSGAFKINSSTAAAAYGTITHVQSAGLGDTPTDGSSSTIAKAFTSNNTAGNLIVVSVSWGDSSGSTTISCSDTRGNTYTTLTSAFVADTVNDQALSVCYAPNIAGGSNTVTVTFRLTSNGSPSSESWRRMTISEYSGAVTTNPVDVVATSPAGGSAGNTTANGITTNSATTTQSGDLIYGAVMDTEGGNNITAGTNTTPAFTQRVITTNLQLAVQDFQQIAAGSIASTQKFSIAHRYVAAMVTFKAQQSAMTDTNTNALFKLTQNGALTITNSSDSTTGFQVLNASAVPQFVIDTSNSRVYVGNPTADATGALLVLDTKNTSGDPTGVAGAMYYNSSSNSFRCYSTSWGDCGPRVGKLAADQSAASTTGANATGLGFSVAANTDYSFTCRLVFSGSASNAGLMLGFTAPTSPTALSFTANIPSASAGTGGVYHAYGTAASTLYGTTDVPGVSTKYVATIDGVLRNGANAGTLQLQFARSASNQSNTLYQGSSCELRQL